LILQGSDNIYDYNHDGYFRCSRSGEPIYEGEPYLKINGERISKKWIDDNWSYASVEDSSYYDYINREVHEKLERS